MRGHLMPRRKHQTLTREEEEQVVRDMIAEFRADCAREGVEPQELIDELFLSPADLAAKKEAKP